MNIPEVFDKGIAEINLPMTPFTQDNELDPAEITGGEATNAKTHLGNGETTTLLTRPPYKFPPLVDALESPLMRT